MRKVWVVALREYNAAVRSKAFIISLVIMPVMMGGSVLVQWLLRDVRDTADQHFAVVDRSPGERYWPALEKAVEAYNASGKGPRFEARHEKAPATDEELKALRVRLSDEVRAGKLIGFLEVGPDVGKLGPPAEAAERRALRYQTNRPTHDAFSRFAEQVITRAAQERRARQAKLDVKDALAVAAPVPLEPLGLSKRDKEGKVVDAGAESRAAAFLVPFGMMMLMFVVVLLGATPLMQGVVEEKMQRIAEVLLGSVPPFSLMLGKILGMTAVSLTIAAVYLAGGYWALHQAKLADFLPLSLLAWFVLFEVLASLMYGSLFIAVGAACTDMKETQTLLWPVMLLATLPMLMMGTVLQQPNSTVATALSFFPFATPTLMVVRLSIPPGLPWWQPALGAVVVLGTTLACVWAAGRIFRVGILMQGKGARPAEVLRWVLRG